MFKFWKPVDTELIYYNKKLGSTTPKLFIALPPQSKNLRENTRF